MAFAEIALGQIKALRQPATPRNYEVWYTYATGYNPSLNQTINETLAQQRHADRCRSSSRSTTTYISSDPLHRPIDNVGTQVMDEIEQVMAMIDAAAGSAIALHRKPDQRHATSSAPPRTATACAPSSKAWSRPPTRWKQNNHALEQRLNASKQEINQLQENLEVGPQREPDRSADLARQPQVLRRGARAGDRAKRAERSEPLSLMMTDIDHFKNFNDTFGHLTGDQVLRLVAMSVKQNVKGQDIAARYGGEEFAVILPNTVLRSALTVADHIRRAVMIEGTDEALDRRESRPGHDLARRRDRCARATPRSR